MSLDETIGFYCIKVLKSFTPKLRGLRWRSKARKTSFLMKRSSTSWINIWEIILTSLEKNEHEDTLWQWANEPTSIHANMNFVHNHQRKYPFQQSRPRRSQSHTNTKLKYSWRKTHKKTSSTRSILTKNKQATIYKKIKEGG